MFKRDEIFELSLRIAQAVFDFNLSFTHEFFQNLFTKLREVDVNFRKSYVFILCKNSRYVSLCLLFNVVVVGTTERVDYFFYWFLLAYTVKMRNLLDIDFVRMCRLIRKN